MAERRRENLFPTLRHCRVSVSNTDANKVAALNLQSLIPAFIAGKIENRLCAFSIS